MSFSRILVTGASGLVGGYLVPALRAAVAKEARIVVASRVVASVPDFDHVRFDLTDVATVDAAVSAVRPDLVVHLAAQASVGQSIGISGETWAVNLCGSLALASAIAREVPDCTMLLVSSAEVYGLTFNRGRVTEMSPLRPQSAYARSKAAVENMLVDVLPPTARLVVARPANHTGPDQDDRFVVPAFATQIAQIEAGLTSEVQVGNLDAERDFLDVRDVVAAYMALLTIAPSLPMRSVFNIASGQPVRIGEILKRLCAMSTVEPCVVQDPNRMRPSEVPRAEIDVAAILGATGWAPTHGLDALLLDVLAAKRRGLGLTVATA